MESGNSGIFSPFTIKGFTFKNRLGVAPMTRTSADEASIPRQDVLDFLVRRARNGAGLVYTEALVTDYESAQGYPGQSRITNSKQIEAWKSVAEKIREHGSVGIIQLFHCGRIAYEGVNPANRVIAPSPISPVQGNSLTGRKYPLPDEMSKFDIDHVINGFVESAKGAVEAGFDGIEIHGAHGYLISQFLSSYSNKRNDYYGGTLENRFRFACEIIESVKAVVPDDILLFFRISNWGIADMEVSLFEDQVEWQQLITLLSRQDIDAISVSAYDFQKNEFGTDYTMSQLTRQVTELPLLICGKIYDHRTAELALQDADFALSAKSMLLNQHFVEDIRNQRELKPYSAKDADIAYTGEKLL
ncbi:oxidoreductase [Desulfopila inferna]|uniref:oxidoreductase n=1 Tax=Desulfopila inferna TaxID=468528 RepID=UPI00196246B1|nr:NADH-dependent flavin oxidoreductase [Desulfopila inferna]MBM9603024.1 NADH-dependent flavin oxidoreductase [Desulfopila inferna]